LANISDVTRQLLRKEDITFPVFAHDEQEALDC